MFNSSKWFMCFQIKRCGNATVITQTEGPWCTQDDVTFVETTPALGPANRLIIQKKQIRKTIVYINEFSQWTIREHVECSHNVGTLKQDGGANAQSHMTIERWFGQMLWASSRGSIPAPSKHAERHARPKHVTWLVHDEPYKKKHIQVKVKINVQTM